MPPWAPGEALVRLLQAEHLKGNGQDQHEALDPFRQTQKKRWGRERDWIKKHIFPGGLLPSLTVLTRTMTRHSRLMVAHAENIGDHCALTLAEWRRRFLAAREDIARMGFDRTFQRKWI